MLSEDKNLCRFVRGCCHLQHGIFGKVTRGTNIEEATSGEQKVDDVGMTETLEKGKHEN